MQVTFTETADEHRAYLTRRAVAKATESHAYLLGKRTADGVRIEHVIRAGTPVEEAAMTRPDFGAAGRVLAPYLDAGFQVVGEWHRHDAMRGPSGGDVRTLREIEQQFPGYLCAITTTFRDGREPITTAHNLNNGMLAEHAVHVERYAVLRREMTRERSVFITGAGSGLASVFPQLIKLGFKSITIADPDTFEERNLERHLADRTAIGKNKAVYLKRFACGRTTTSVRALPLSIEARTQVEFAKEVRRHDIIWNATGHPLASLRISDTARRFGKPVIHAGVFARGRGGFVFLELPHGPCYACAQQLDVPTISDDNATMHLLREQYGYTDEELAAVAGLWADVATVAILQLKVLVEYLKGKTPHNLYTIDNEHLTIERHLLAQREVCICKGATP